MGDAADSHLSCSVCFAAFDGDQRRPWVSSTAGSSHRSSRPMPTSAIARGAQLLCLRLGSAGAAGLLRASAGFVEA
jgi:hypothetical protein